MVATDAQASVAAHDPWLGAAMAVAECARNVAVTGARPLGVTNCLNFGDPSARRRSGSFTESVRGLGDACRALGLPVTGGNVSLYNESPSGAIAPTAQIGIVGLLDDVEQRVGPAFRAAGDVVVLVGETVPGLAARSMPSSRAPRPTTGRRRSTWPARRRCSAGSRPPPREGLLRSAQDVSGGGLAVALAECAIWGGSAPTLQLGVGSAPAVDLFGEGPGRVVVPSSPTSWSGWRGSAAASRAAHPAPRARRRRAAADRLVGEGATGAAEERGAGVADELDEPLA